MSIHVSNLYKSYNTHPALKGISFTAKPGRILGFLGPNGAGKSTTMKILSGSIALTTGTASVYGIDILQNALEARRHLGYLPENNPLYLDMYVQEALAFAAEMHHIPHKQARISEVIGMTGLIPEQHKKISQLSKGYRQRVGLAQAILHDPEVLILDEPTSGLDPNQLQGIRALIKQLGKAKTVLLSTHIMQEVEAICDDVVIIHQGQIIADFPLSELPMRYTDANLEALFIRLTTTG
ncbi:ATP-binding cassette domain-containing protein [Parapedobacter koreensis]|uniref:ABC-2 type transport system ATP-binding protein n=1 Tax=Parapedobacter koreensis TaxID=332977 RepID=A0A1H7I411_9SPHI|nr:ATP-binding cassette domain-containing protein [Parapedobacter koreensis]SEK57261.1 ABC-2 type transport system ATP-binding protein [Parapedobacter koreensis]